jgi:hypothetical protein
MLHRQTLIASAIAFCFTIEALTVDATPPATVADLAAKTAATANKAPEWTKGGAFVYRLATPDSPNVLPAVEQGLAITNHLLDGSVHQIPFIMGLIGTDQPGKCNWDGLWPYWDRVTYRAGDWNALHDFMLRAKDQDNTLVSFHVNLTDVNDGLRAYPETQAFFQKLVATKSMYRRDMNPATHKRDIEPPYVLQEFPKDASDPVTIISLVNYKNFWESGLAKEMIDGFYSHLPYAPPVLYVDVLTTMGGNFNTGFPTGPLGGSEQTQQEGVYDIVNYLKSKGTSLATEGDRPYLFGKGATYGWLHCIPGISTDDYSYIAGTARYTPIQQVAGNTGCFDVAPIASTPDMLAKVREHYANLLAGKPDPKVMPSLQTGHIADRSGINDEFDVIPGTDGKPGIPGDAYRGDWIDNIDNFYLTGIQELYHIGKGSYRTAVFKPGLGGIVHVTKFGITDPSGAETFTPASDCAPPAYVAVTKKTEDLMLQLPFEIHYNAAQAGKYHLKLYGHIPGSAHAALNVYVNGELTHTDLDISFPSQKIVDQPFPLGDLVLKAGDNLIGFDVGPIYMKWSDGTEALWTTPYLRKGFKVTNGDVTFADDYDRMWPDTWSGQKKIYFFSWDGTNRTWKLPQDWASVEKATLYPLTPDGRGAGIPLGVADRSLSPKLLPQVPYVLVPQ